jgi:ABC-2 type transport system ATP-binding protein
MTNVIELHSVSKKYSKSNRFSLEDVSFSIKKGEKLGVFGPNGAGKTTLMSILCRIISQTSGEVNYKSESGNLSNNAFLNSIGYVPQDFSLYAELSPYQNLRYFGTLYGIQKADLAERIDELLTVLGLHHVRHKKIHTFSGGMKRRVNLAIGIINNPSILFLDEPTVGVDVQSKNAIMAYLEELNKKGTTIIYTSHHMNEAEEFCDNIVLLDQGKLIVHDDLKSLIKKHNATDLQALFLQLTGIEYRD